jgi:hypothetical protein
MKLKNTTKLRTKLRGNGVLASLAWGKFEELYEIEGVYEIKPMLSKTSLRKSLTTF